MQHKFNLTGPLNQIAKEKMSPFPLYNPADSYCFIRPG